MQTDPTMYMGSPAPRHVVAHRPSLRAHESRSCAHRAASPAPSCPCPPLASSSLLLLPPPPARWVPFDVLPLSQQPWRERYGTHENSALRMRLHTVQGREPSDGTEGRERSKGETTPGGLQQRPTRVAHSQSSSSLLTPHPWLRGVIDRRRAAFPRRLHHLSGQLPDAQFEVELQRQVQ